MSRNRFTGLKAAAAVIAGGLLLLSWALVSSRHHASSVTTVTESTSSARQVEAPRATPDPVAGEPMAQPQVSATASRCNALPFFSSDIAATNALLALELAMGRMAAEDPKGLVAWVKNVLQQGGDFEGLNASQVAATAVEALVQKDNGAIAREAVEQWTQIPGGPDIGNIAYEDAALDLSAKSPAAAMDWLKSLAAGTDRNYALTTLAAVWTKTDPRAALDWTAQLADADGRAEVMERAFNQWAQDDDNGARQWLTGHLTDPAAEKMLISMVAESGLSYSNPQEAIVWADLISDPAVRLENVEDIFLSWVRRDPDAAANYIKDDPTLTADEKKQVLDSFYGWKNFGTTN